MDNSVCVLLSTFNGEAYLEEQLNSLFNQKKVNLTIWVRDDGSNDGTQEILNKYQMMGKLSWFQGNNIGPAKSFMELLKTAPHAQYYCFCDQDDYWDEYKINAGIKRMRQLDSEVPMLYFSEITPVDEKLQNLKYEGLNPKIDIYAECIMNYAYGCTMIFNDILKLLIDLDTPHFIDMHDWWVYLICLSCGGQIIYDSESYILYRQHGKNASGVKESFLHQLKRRIIDVLIKKENRRSRMLQELYRIYNGRMCESIKQLIYNLAFYDTNFGKKLQILNDSNLQCGKRSSDLTFKLSILINRF